MANEMQWWEVFHSQNLWQSARARSKYCPPSPPICWPATRRSCVGSVCLRTPPTCRRPWQRYGRSVEVAHCPCWQCPTRFLPSAASTSQSDAVKVGHTDMHWVNYAAFCYAIPNQLICNFCHYQDLSFLIKKKTLFDHAPLIKARVEAVGRDRQCRCDTFFRRHLKNSPG